MKFYCQADRNLLHDCVSVQFQFASLLKESQLKLLVDVKVVWKNFDRLPSRMIKYCSSVRRHIAQNTVNIQVSNK
jgi:hypothetical protein